MANGISMTSRLTLTLSLSALLLASLALTVTGVSEYHKRGESLRSGLTSLSDSSAEISGALLRRDFRELTIFVEGIRQRPFIRGVSLHDLRGIPLATSGKDSAPEPLPRKDGELPALIEEAQGDIDRLSIPLFSRVDPTSVAGNSGESPPATGRNDSRHLAGYLTVDIDNQTVRQSVIGDMRGPAVVALFGCCVFALLAWWSARRVTRPLTQLAVIAEEIAGGERHKPVELEGSSEVRRIARLLNVIIDRFDSYRAQLDVDHQLLGMKVAERTSQLSDRNRELKDAVRQITAAKERMRRLAYYDSLTSLPNRQLFSEQLELLLRLAKRNDTRLALMFIDLDNFKRINDSLGHSVGDQLLAQVADRIVAGVRDSDVVGHISRDGESARVSRLGGDEFTVILSQVTDVDAVKGVAKRLLAALSSPFSIGTHDLVVTPSIGIALAPDHAKSVVDLLRRADRAMYQAKSRGKNTFCFFDGNLEADEAERLRLESDLRKALERGELFLQFQPQIDLVSGDIVGAEALVRWEHPERGLVSPAQFIPLAEEIGLIGEVGNRVLELACEQIASFREEGVALPKIAVNVSSLQFHAGYARNVMQLLERLQIQPGQLELELTESVIVEHISETMRALEELRAAGVRLSVDDFGTGYSSLSYLSRFPLNELKIDRSFVIEIGRSDSASSVINAIIAMGQGLGLELVAEGVETADQCRFLYQRGVHTIQGYLFSKPLRAQELAALIRPAVFADRLQELNLNG